MKDVLQTALDDLTETEVDFLCDKFNMSREELMNSSEETLDDIYDDLCEMEIEETIAAGESDLSETGKIVSNIVTTMGVAIAVSTGQYDKEDFDCYDPES